MFNVPSEAYVSYLDRLVSKVFKILPMKEEGIVTTDSYIDALIRELVGTKEVVEFAKKDGEFLGLIGTIQNLKNETDITIIKTDVFKSIDTIKKIKSNHRG